MSPCPDRFAAMSPRQRGLRPPAEYLISGDWPTGGVRGPIEVEYARQFCLRLANAIKGRPIRDVARGANISHTTVIAVLAGARWPDMATVAKLEVALASDLWPGSDVRAKLGGMGRG